MNVWDIEYQKVEQFWGMTPDYKLVQYKSLFNDGEILDIGVGEGRNCIPFIENKFKIHGVDVSKTAISRCNELFNTVKEDISIDTCFEVADLNNMDFEQNRYSGIIAANVLNFFKKSESEKIIHGLKDALKKDGIIYISAFSIHEPKYLDVKVKYSEIEENTYYVEEKKTYVHYFTKEELVDQFRGFELISCFEGVELDLSHGEPHYHGGIDILFRKR